ncbi:MAG: hypothetical protein JWM99_3560 [Verrucomicrobiales bacterium]|nr:hypothetical protein [Verrucomicrobiales bacterium]
MLPTGEIIQVHVNQLPDIHSSLASLLVQEYPDASHLDDLLANYIEAECVQCGIRISGEEIGKIRSLKVKGQAPEPKLMRLKRNYCARDACFSCDYRINLLPHPSVDWQKIKGQLVEERTASQEKSELVTTTFISRPGWRVMLCVAAAAALVLFFLLRHWITGARIPLLQKAHHYQIDPGIR